MITAALRVAYPRSSVNGWIVPVSSPALDTTHQLAFDHFLNGVDVVVGRHCYDQGQHRDYAELDKRVVVASSTPPAPVDAEEYVEFVGQDVVEVVRDARRDGQHCFLFGGGVLVESFPAADAVDMKDSRVRDRLALVAGRIRTDGRRACRASDC